MTAVKVLPKGQITLPRKIRTELHIKEGDTLLLERTADGVFLRRGKTIFDFLGKLPGKGLTPGQMREQAVAAAAKDRA